MDGPAVQIHDRSRDGQPQPEPAEAMIVFPARLLEGMEDRFQGMGLETDARVADFDAEQTVRFVAGADGDAPAGRA